MLCIFLAVVFLALCHGFPSSLYPRSGLEDLRVLSQCLLSHSSTDRRPSTGSTSNPTPAFYSWRKQNPKKDRIYSRGLRANYSGHDTKWVSFRVWVELFWGFWPWLNKYNFFTAFQIVKRWFLLYQKSLFDSKALSASALRTPPHLCTQLKHLESPREFLFCFILFLCVSF